MIYALEKALSRAPKVPTKIACIGSRELGSDEISLCVRIGHHIASLGAFVGSGNALGADQAYARGSNAVSPAQTIVYLPWASYENSALVAGNRVRVCGDDAEYRTLAAPLHPAWDRLSRGVRALHTRNVGIIQGASVVIAWPNASKPHGGGTSMGIRTAKSLSIPVLDLTVPAVFEAMCAYIP